MDNRQYLLDAVENPPLPPESPSVGYPADGNELTGQEATAAGAFWFYQIGESLRNLITGAGLTPDAEDLTLIYQSVAQMIADANTALPIGSVFPIWDHLPGSQKPSNAGTAKYIKLTAGEDGVGGFNEGLLTGESITGAAPHIIATAQIAVGPMAGGTVHLRNTERTFSRAGSSGVLQEDEFKSHTHQTGTGNGAGSGPGYLNSSAVYGYTTSAAGGDETRPRNVGETYYMRIA